MNSLLGQKVKGQGHKVQNIMKGVSYALCRAAQYLVKPGFHYPRWRPELTGDRFHGPCWRVIETGHPSTLVVISGRQLG